MKKNSLARNLTIYIALAISASIIFYFLSERYVIRQVEKNIENVLLSHKGIHYYVQERMLPAFYDYQKENKIPGDFFAPEFFSSTYIIRNQHEYYNRELKHSGFKKLFYRLAAKNPRNPVNKADEFEQDLISKFNNDRSLRKYREILDVDGDKYLYIAIPFLENTKNCLRCHGKREDAPKQLQEMYPGKGGFNEKLGEIRALASIRAPLHEEYRTLYIILASFVVGSTVLILLLSCNYKLRRKVRDSVGFLEEEIREKHEIATRLNESESYLKSVQDNMQVGLFLIDKESYAIVDVNKVALEMAGLPREEVVNRKCYSFLCPEEKGLCPVSDNIQDKSENIFVTGDGKEIPVLKTVTVIKLEGATYLLETFIDITEQKEIEAAKAQLEKRMTQANKIEAIGTLAGGIAHDFNNILGAILGYTELAREDSPPGSSVIQNLDNVLTAVDRAKGFVEQILAFSSQVETGRNILQPAVMVNEVLNMLRPSLPSTIEIIKDIDDETGNISADPSQIQQILMNLCTNAYHAMEESGGKLEISVKEKYFSSEEIIDQTENVEAGRFVQISISDSGVGIDPAIKDKVFDPYFTTKEEGKGNGLGLAIVNGIVNGYGGFISLQSELGKGAAFHIFLPVTDEVEADESDDVEQNLVGNENILFVDDEEVLTEIGTVLLERLGYNVTVKNNGTDALEAFQSRPDFFDVVITDQTMPGITGIELSKRLLRIRPDIPIILCTGYSTVVSREKAKSVGIKEFALKPFSMNYLGRLLRKVLNNPDEDNSAT